MVRLSFSVLAKRWTTLVMRKSMRETQRFDANTQEKDISPSYRSTFSSDHCVRNHRCVNNIGEEQRLHSSAIIDEEISKRKMCGTCAKKRPPQIQPFLWMKCRIRGGPGDRIRSQHPFLSVARRIRPPNEHTTLALPFFEKGEKTVMNKGNQRK